MRSSSASSILLSLNLVSIAVAQPTPNADLDVMLRHFAQLPGLSAKFEEEKRIALLAVPLRSEGEIHFSPPGRLLRRVTSPTASVALIANGRITLSSAGQRQEIDLESNPIVAGFVDSFRHVLAGDRAALERTYQVGFERDNEQWTLTLRPRTAALQRFLREMKLEGRGTVIEKMTMREVSGDTTLTRFHDVSTHRWTDAERARTFQL